MEQLKKQLYNIEIESISLSEDIYLIDKCLTIEELNTIKSKIHKIIAANNALLDRVMTEITWII